MGCHIALQLAQTLSGRRIVSHAKENTSRVRVIWNLGRVSTAGRIGRGAWRQAPLILMDSNAKGCLAQRRHPFRPA